MHDASRLAVIVGREPGSIRPGDQPHFVEGGGQEEDRAGVGRIAPEGDRFLDTGQAQGDSPKCAEGNRTSRSRTPTTYGLAGGVTGLVGIVPAYRWEWKVFGREIREGNVCGHGGLSTVEDVGAGPRR